MLGWTDTANHIRVGFEGGGFGDCGGEGSCAFPLIADGFWIVQEIGGVATTLVQESTFTFVRNQAYELSLSVVAGVLSYDFDTNGGDVFAGSVNPTAPTNGAFGVYTESQSASFTNITLTSNVSAVPLPASALFLLAGLGGMGAVARRKAAKS